MRTAVAGTMRQVNPWQLTHIKKALQNRIPKKLEGFVLYNMTDSTLNLPYL